MPTVTVVRKTEAEKKLRVQVLLSQMIVAHDPKTRSVSSFAKRVGVSRQYVYMCLDTGYCSAVMVRKLQKQFGVAAAPMDELCWSKINL